MQVFFPVKPEMLTEFAANEEKNKMTYKESEGDYHVIKSGKNNTQKVVPSEPQLDSSRTSDVTDVILLPRSQTKAV